jgi:hypothetical protein
MYIVSSLELEFDGYLYEHNIVIDTLDTGCKEIDDTLDSRTYEYLSYRLLPD